MEPAAVEFAERSATGAGAGFLFVVGRVSMTVFQDFREGTPLGIESHDGDIEPNMVPVCGFGTQEEAEECLIEMELVARREYPFGTTVTAMYRERSWTAAVREAIRELGYAAPILEPPAGAHREYNFVPQALRNWWFDVGCNLTPEQNEFLWNRVQSEPFFYGIQRIPFDPEE